MKVRLKAGTMLDRWLTHDQEYVVLSVGLLPGRTPWLRLLGDEGFEAMFDASDFVVSDDRLSTRWVASIGERGELELAPASWLADDFWERFYSDLPADEPGPPDRRSYDAFWYEVGLMNEE